MNAPKETLSRKHIVKRRYTRQASDAWDQFNKEEGSAPESLRTVCNYCGQTYACDPKRSGTSNINKHLETCKKYAFGCDESKPKFLFPQRKDNEGEDDDMEYDDDMWDDDVEDDESSFMAVSFSQQKCREALAFMVIEDGLPLTVVESEGFLGFFKTIQPNFVIPSRSTLAKDCYQLYMNERKKLKSKLVENVQRVCLTVETWTSDQGLDFIVLTAFFVDNDWNFYRRILIFCQIEDQKGETIGKAIEKCLYDWGIEKLFTMTINCASSNDVAVAYLIEKFKGQNVLVLNGEFLHVGCYTNIINLIVNDILIDLQESIVRIRNALMYVKASLVAFKIFKDSSKEDNISSTINIYIDVPTRWDSTYQMLESAIKFQRNFERLETQDPDYLVEVEGVPTGEDWDNARVLVKFLKIFLEVTRKFSKSVCVTSNVYLHQFCFIQGMIREYSLSDDFLLSTMARSVQAKFSKYWGDGERTNLLLYVAVVLDPRYKLKFVKFCFKEFLEEEVAIEMSDKVERALRQLVDEYFSNMSRENVNQISQSQPVDSELNLQSETSIIPHQASLTDKFIKFLDEEEGPYDGKKEVDRYLKESFERIDVDFDILKWWKFNSSRFEILSQVAKDIFSIPISTVDSEFAFTTGGRVLDSSRSTLPPNIMEALICTQNWFGFERPDFREEMEDAELYEEELSRMLAEEDSASD